VATATNPIRCTFWGNRVGKTQLGGQEIARLALGINEYDVKVYYSETEYTVEHVVNPPIETPVEIWSACPSYDSQKDTTQRVLEQYIPASEIVDKSYVGKHIWREIRLANGSKINFKSYEQGREKFQGAGKRMVWFDEEPPHDIWEECFVRVEAGQKFEILLTMTPINGMTWTYDDLYLATGNSDIYVSTAGWDDNPWLTEDIKAQMERGLTEESLQVRKYGKFIQRVGLVCDWWRRDVHLVTDMVVDPEWQVYRAADFGYSAFNCVVYIGVDNQDNWHVFDGFYKNKLTTSQLAEEIKNHDKGKFITDAWADAAGAQNMADLQMEDIKFKPVKKMSETKLEDWDEYRAQILAEHGKVDKVTNRPRLFISADLTYFDEKIGSEANWAVQEIENLRWTENKSSTGESRPRWGDQRKHFIDALTYFATSVHKGEFHMTAIKPIPEITTKDIVNIMSNQAPSINDPAYHETWQQQADKEAMERAKNRRTF
jgi:phage terminase large subunit-like protein